MQDDLDFFLILTQFLLTLLNHVAFDSNVIEIDKNDVTDFLGTLDFLLKQATRGSSGR